MITFHTLENDLVVAPALLRCCRADMPLPVWYQKSSSNGFAIVWVESVSI